MLESRFKLAYAPFAPAPDARRYFPAASIEDARDRCARTIQRREGIALVLGNVGLGKSMLLEVLATQLVESHAVVRLSSTRLASRKGLLQTILHDLDLPFAELDEGVMRLALIDRLQQVDTLPLALLVDEGHLLSRRILEELRGLTNVAVEGEGRVALCIAALPLFEERLAEAHAEEFQQRITARCYLSGWSYHETTSHILAQVAAAGGDDDLFADSALDAVHQATDGVPRLVNQLCDHALIVAAAQGHEQLTGDVIQSAWQDLQQLPTPHLFVPVASQANASPLSELKSDAAATVEFGSWDTSDQAEADKECVEARECVEAESLPEVEFVEEAALEEPPQPEFTFTSEVSDDDFSEEIILDESWKHADHLSKPSSQPEALVPPAIEITLPEDDSAAALDMPQQPGGEAAEPPEELLQQVEAITQQLESMAASEEVFEEEEPIVDTLPTIPTPPLPAHPEATTAPEPLVAMPLVDRPMNAVEGGESAPLESTGKHDPVLPPQGASLAEESPSDRADEVEASDSQVVSHLSRLFTQLEDRTS